MHPLFITACLFRFQKKKNKSVSLSFSKISLYSPRYTRTDSIKTQQIFCLFTVLFIYLTKCHFFQLVPLFSGIIAAALA